MSEIRVDTISEKTSANGVSIDSLAIKDGKITNLMNATLSAADLGVGLHIKTGDSGGSANANADELILEGTGSGSGVGMGILAATDGFGYIVFGDSGGNAQGGIQYHNNGDSMRIYTNDSERVRIDSSGKVGISTSSPTTPLTVNGIITHIGGTASSTSDLTTGGIHFHDSSTADGAIMPITFTPSATANRARAGIGFISQSQDGSAGFAADIAFYTRGAADGSTLGTADERMRLDKSGALILKGSNGDLNFAGNGNTITFNRNADNYITAAGGTSSNLVLNGQNRVVVQTNNTERMRIDSNGKVAIGTASEVQAFGDDRKSLTIRSESSGHYGVLQISGNADSDDQILGIVNFYNETTSCSRIDSTRVSNTSDANLRFWTAPSSGGIAERMRIHSDGVVSASAGIALGVGTANTASNVLDDYEEGTWTPTLSSNATPTAYSLQVGVYTKIGRMVHVSCQVQMSDVGSFAGATINVNGLPFTSGNNSVDTIGALQLNATAIATSPDIHVRIPANNAYARLENASGATTTDNNMNANRLDTGTRVRFTAVYSI